VRPFVEDAGELKAAYSVAGTWPAFEVTFESGDGRGRNSDYRRGVEVVLERLGARGAVLHGARISSKAVANRLAVDGVGGAFTPTGYQLPIGLEGADMRRIRLSLGHAGALVASKPNSSGNSTRRLTLAVALPPPALSAGDLEMQLAGRPDSRTYTLIDKLEGVDSALAGWRVILESASQIVGGRLRWIASEAITLEVRASSKRIGAHDIRLGIHAAGEPWAVEINAPSGATDANGLTTIAKDPSGRLILLRQGRLRANPDSSGDILEAAFKEFSGLVPVATDGAHAHTVRDWYVVADLTASPEEVLRRTGHFVHACARARLGTRGILAGDGAPGREPIISEASGERGGVFVKRAVAPQPEKEIRRLQGEVWLALQSHLEKSNIALLKLRHEGGYEVDGLIVTPTRRILIEIKTGGSASDIYEGVGQLLIYSRMFGLVDCPPSAPLRQIEGSV
jgi:hypothetical protein